MKTEILETEIVDHNIINDMDDDCLKSSISVMVKVQLLTGDIVYIDYQTSTTQDCGAVSSRLKAYTDTDDYEMLKKFCEKEQIGIEHFLEIIKKQSHAQSTWNDYINEYYITDDRHYNGMDANSERDNIKKRS